MDNWMMWTQIAGKSLLWPAILSVIYFSNKEKIMRSGIFIVALVILSMSTLSFNLIGKRVELVLDGYKQDEELKTELAKLELQHTEYLRVAALQGIKTDVTRGYLIWRPEE